MPIAAYPTDVDAHITLADDRRVRLRALHVREEAPIRALYAKLGEEARYQRFLSPMPSLPEAIVRRLTAVDYCRSLAIVAEDAGSADVVGIARFNAADADTAEVAIAIADSWQGRGLGTALAGALLNAAERRGFHTFAADIASDNTAMRRILTRFGRIVASRTSSGVSEVLFVRRA